MKFIKRENRIHPKNHRRISKEEVNESRAFEKSASVVNKQESIMFPYNLIFYDLLSNKCSVQSMTKSKIFKHKVKRIIFYIFGFLMHIYLIYRFLILKFRIDHGIHTIKSALILVIREIIVLLIWYGVFIQWQQITLLFIKIDSFPELISKSKKKMLNKLLHMVQLIIFFSPVMIASMRTALLSPTDAIDYQFFAMFGYTTTPFANYLNFSMLLIHNSYILVLPLTVSSMYVFICIHINKMLQYCQYHVCKKQIFNFKFFKILNTTIQIFYLIESLETALSSCIFLVISLNLTICFSSLTYALGYYEADPSPAAGFSALFFANMLSLILIVFAASNTNIAYSDLKRSCIVSISRFETLTQEVPSYLLLKLLAFDDIILTGLKVFEFKKSVFLKLAGTLLTYGLLILQLKKSTEKN